MEKFEKKLLSNLESLKKRRLPYDTVNQDITDYVLPNRGDFTFEGSEGKDRSVITYDSTAKTACQNLAAVLLNGLTDPRTSWAKIKLKNNRLNNNDEVKVWLKRLEDLIFDVVNSGEGGFTSANHQVFLDLIGYGTAILYVGMDLENSRIFFQARHLSQIWIEENNTGIVDTVYREFEYTARQAAQEWGEEKLGPKVKELLIKDPHGKTKFLHCVFPVKDYERAFPGRDGVKDGDKFVSLYLSEEDENIVDTGSYSSMPYIVVRWTKRVGEVYGTSPSWNVLSDIKMLNGFKEISIRAAQKSLDPVLLSSEDGIFGTNITSRPGGLIAGGLGDDGEPLIKPLIVGQNVQITELLLQSYREQIEKAYFVDQFQSRQGVQPLTATESNNIEQNKMLLMSPQSRRVEEEYLNILINRVISMLDTLSLLPDNMPDALFEEVNEKGLEFNIEYVGPLSYMQQSNQLLSYNRFLANIGTFIQIDPGTVDNLDLDGIVRSGAEKSGIPLEQIRTKAQVLNLRQQKQQVLQQEQQKSDLQAGADTLATLQKSGVNILPQ